VSSGHPDAKIDGAAVRWRLRRGAGTLYSGRSSSIRSPSSIYRYGAGIWRDAREWRDARRTALVLSGQIRRCLVAIYLVVVLQWLEPQAARQIAASYSINKAALGRPVHGSCSPPLCFSVLGESEKMELVEVFCGAADLRQGSWEAPIGRASASALSLLPLLMVERRPLPPSSSATALSGRRLQVIIYLQAVVPFRRPCCSSSVGSRYVEPSGLVPGVDVVGRAVVLRQGGEGAGPDCFHLFTSTRVLNAKCKDLCVIFSFLIVLDVNCNSTADNQW
jgi:hypothetical protein